MTYLYLLTNLSTIFFPLVLSFDGKVHYYKKWKYLFPAMIITAVPFIIWDMWFTQEGVWGFNEVYLTGFSIGNLPVEEVMFFFSVPYASVFIYECLISYTKKQRGTFRTQQLIAFTLASCSLVFGVLHHEQDYTFTTFLFLGIYLLIVGVLKSTFLTSFLISYCITAFPFYLVNGLLTGSWIPDQIVWYNDEEHLGVRLGTIPVVDFFYGMLLILMNISIFEWLRTKRSSDVF